MGKVKEKLTVIYQNGKKRIVVKSPTAHKRRIVIVINNQFTNAPNTTQIASGAGRSSAAGSNAAIDSSNTLQQQSVGANGVAKNLGMKGKQSQPQKKRGKLQVDKEIVVVLNNQVVKRRKKQTSSSATQIASGGGKFSAGGTNSAIESSNTKQQHAVGGGKGARAINKGENAKQIEGSKRKKRLGKFAAKTRRLGSRKNHKPSLRQK